MIYKDSFIVRLRTLLGVLVCVGLFPMIALAQNDSSADISVISQDAINRSYITYAPGDTTERWPRGVGSNHDIGFFAGDFSGDGSDDVACVDFDANDSAYAVVTNSPGQSSNDQAVWDTALRSSNELTFYFLPGDFDGDGKFDIASLYLEATGGDDNNVYGKITFGPDGETQTVDVNDWEFIGRRDSAFLAGRFLGTGGENDDIYDIATVTRNGNDFDVDFYQGPSGAYDVANQWTVSPPTAQDIPVGFRAGDFDGDSNTDVVALFYNSNTTSYTARITFGSDGSSTEDWDLGNTALVSILVNDFNGDGIDDIAGVSKSGGDSSATVHLANSDGQVDSVANWSLKTGVANVAQFLAGKFQRPTYTISGTVYQSDGSTGLALVTVTTDTGLTATTDQNGMFIITGAVSGDYTVSASKASHTFTPSSIDVTVSEANVTGLTFDTLGGDPEIYTVSGTVTQIDGTTGLAGATITIDDFSISAKSAVTGVDGTFEFTNMSSGTYTVTISKTQHSFTPSSQLAVVNGADKPSIDFRASNNPTIYTISGTVYREDGTSGLDGVLVSAGTGLNATTADDGTYTITSISSGSYTVTATKPGFEFNTSSQAITVNGASVSPVNYVATSEPGVTISGKVIVGENQSVIGAVVSAGNYTTTTDSEGNYVLQNVAYGTYTLSAELSGFVIEPSTFSNPVSVILNDLPGYDFNSQCSKDFNLVGNVCLRQGSPPGVVPTVIASDGTSENFVTVTWSVAESAQSYQVYRSRYPDDSGIAVGDLATSTTVQDKSSVPGVQYYYSVRAYNSQGWGEMSGNDLGWRTSTTDDEDCDGDGVSDSQEENDDTGVCDGGSHQIYLKSPTYAGYNTYLNQYTFVELASAGTATINATVTVYDDQGVVLDVINATIPPLGQVDLNVSEVVAQSDQYGIIKVEYNVDDEGVDLSGRISHYSLAPDGQSFEFAYSRELRPTVRGVTYATGNTMDPKGGGFPIYNWMEIYNVEDVGQGFKYKLYDQDGNQVGDTQSFIIPPYGRWDLQAGHEHGEGVYLAEVIPTDGKRRYLSGITRYGHLHDKNGNFQRYNFSYPINSRPGNGETQYLIVSNQKGGCWSQSNWVEVANVRNKTVVATLRFRDSDGVDIGETEVPLRPMGVQHVNASGMLPLGFNGSVTLSASDAGALVAESVVYFHDCEENEIQSAFSTPGRSAGYTYQTGSYNHFVDSNNHIRILNVSDDSTDVRLDIRGVDSSQAEHFQTLAPKGMLNINISNPNVVALPSDSYGTVSVQSPEENTVLGDNIRIRETVDGRVDFVVPSAMR